MKYDKTYFEIYAKLSLELLYDSKLSNLEKFERPDWILKDNSLGIEITRAGIEKWINETKFITKDFGKGLPSNEVIDKINKKRKHEIMGELFVKNDIAGYSCTKGLYNFDIHILKIIESINKKKYDKLPKYKKLKEYWLYVFAEVPLNISDIENIKNGIKQKEVEKNFKKIFINCGDIIYIIDNTKQIKEIIVENEVLKFLKKESLKLSIN